MAEMLNFGEAVQRAGVSRQRLNHAINSGRLPAARGGSPGKPTAIQIEDLQAWCLGEGLAMPVQISERLERLDEMFAGMQRLEQLMAQVLERLERPNVRSVPRRRRRYPPRRPRCWIGSERCRPRASPCRRSPTS